MLNDRFISIPAGSEDDKKADLPAILYVSTDFKFGMANETWKNFGLNYPNSRKIPFYRKPEDRDHGKPKPKLIEKICMADCAPLGSAENSLCYGP